MDQPRISVIARQLTSAEPNSVTPLSLPSSFNPYSYSTLHYTTLFQSTDTQHGANTLQPSPIHQALTILHERSLPARFDFPSPSTGAGASATASSIPAYEPQFHCHCQHARELEYPRRQPVAAASITVPDTNTTARRRVNRADTKRRTNGHSAVPAGL